MMIFSEVQNLITRCWLEYKPCRPKSRADVVIFQEHRRSFLAPVLRGEDSTIAEEKQTEAGGSKGSAPGQEEQQDKEEQFGGPK
jgi:hypothetical protein